MIELYHGSDVVVNSPLSKFVRKNLDFGPGFYLTKIKEQAESWAAVIAGRRSRHTKPVLNIYTLNITNAKSDGIRIKEFPEYDLDCYCLRLHLH